MRWPPRARAVPSEKCLGLLQIVDGRPKRVVLGGVKKQEFTTLFVNRGGGPAGLSLSLAMIGTGVWTIDARLFDRKQIDFSEL